MTKKPTQTPHVDITSLTGGKKVQSLDELNNLLTNLPKKETPLGDKTTKEIVAQCKPAIATALANGYSWQQVLDMLKEQTGKEIKMITLKSYMQENRTPMGQGEHAPSAVTRARAAAAPNRVVTRGRDAAKAGAKKAKSARPRAAKGAAAEHDGRRS